MTVETAVFLRLLEQEDKRQGLTQAVRSVRSGKTAVNTFLAIPKTFAQVPGAPFAYWVDSSIKDIFKSYPAFQGEDRIAAIGASTKDDGRFIRAYWEIEQGSEDWPSLVKGGTYSKFYADPHLVIKWSQDGHEAKHFVSSYRAAHGWSPHWKAELHNPHLYFRPGLTWPRRTTSGLAMRAMPSGCIFADKGPAAFVAGDDPIALLALLAITNSQAFRSLVALQLAAADAAARSYEVGVIQRTPVPELVGRDDRALADLSRRGWSIMRALDTAELSSHAFVLPALLQSPGVTLAERTSDWLERVARSKEELRKIQSEVDTRCFDLYGFTDQDRQQVMQGRIDECAEGTDDEAEAEDPATVKADTGVLAEELVDWLVGVALGRFDVRLATGERRPPAEPNPFEALPACSPGMLLDEGGLPVEYAPDEYPLELPIHGVLVDDPGFSHDLSAEWDVLRRIREVVSVVFGEQSTDIEAELCDMIGVRDLRTYLRRPAGFFSDHLARYSKSRRKAPIYWPLSTASGGYTVWVYYPRLDEDTLYTVVNDYVSPKIAEAEARITQLEHERERAEGREATRSATKVNELTEFLDELKQLRQSLKQVAELPYKPSLDDGVQITAAPLWELFRYKNWRNVLEKTWRELSNGDYDWAHLAHAICPDRVREKCRKDRSLAIAHDLEDLYEGEED